MSIEIKAFSCDKCGATYLNQNIAEKCCAIKHCKDCGKELPRKSYRSLCNSCQVKKEYNDAIKLTTKEYLEQYPNEGVFYNDRFYLDIDDCLSDLYDESENAERILKS